MQIWLKTGTTESCFTHATGPLFFLRKALRNVAAQILEGTIPAGFSLPQKAMTSIRIPAVCEAGLGP